MNVASLAVQDEFCLYLWRSLDVPGTLYLANDLASAQAVYVGLVAEGYVVKVIHPATNTEYEMCDGKLLPRLTTDTDPRTSANGLTDSEFRGRPQVS
jgi:hypothetical protein